MQISAHPQQQSVSYAPNIVPQPPPSLSPLPAVSAHVHQAMQQGAEQSEALDAFRDAIKRFPNDGKSVLASLARNFKLCDRSGSGSIDLSEFARCIGLCQLSIDATRVARLHNAFDRDGSGYIPFEEFLRAVRAPMAAARRKAVIGVFHTLDAATNGDGVVTVGDIGKHYDASKLPDVLAGKVAAHEAVRSFLSAFEGSLGRSGREGEVTLSDWMDYYEGVSAEIESDDQFNAMLAGAWGSLKSGLSYVSSRDVDALEAMLYESTYRKKGGSHNAQERLLNEAFKQFDINGDGRVDKQRFFRALERFGLHVKGKSGLPGLGGLPEATMGGLFDRYDTESSGTLSFREFASGLLSRHHKETSVGSLPADEYRPRKPAATPAEEEARMRHPRHKHDHELMAARPLLGGGSILANAARVHGTSKGSKHSGAPFR